MSGNITCKQKKAIKNLSNFLGRKCPYLYTKYNKNQASYCIQDLIFEVKEKLDELYRGLASYPYPEED
jgi:hypothetical protein